MRSIIWFFAAFFTIWGLFRCSIGSPPKSQPHSSTESGEVLQGHVWRALSVNALVKEIHPEAGVYAEYQGLKSCDQIARLVCVYGASEGQSGQLPRVAHSTALVPASLANLDDAHNACRTSLGDGWRVATGKINHFLVGLAPTEASSELVQGEVYRVHVPPPEKNCWNH